MRNIICAKGQVNVNAGDNSFSRGTPLSQTEAATELIINRLAVIDGLQNGRISREDCIVTLPERKFLYENIFDNVVSWSGQKGMDIVSEGHWNKLPYKPFYQNYGRDKDLIHDVPYNMDIVNSDLEDFLICIPRLKRSDTRRNLELSYWKTFIDDMSNHISKIIIFGKDTQHLANGNNIIYVDTLQDYCSYLHHKKCKHVVSTISGPCHYVQQFGNVNGNCTLSMIDNASMIPPTGHEDPSYFHPCINFTNVNINWIKEVPEPNKLKEYI